jgi:hypothetical protein
MALEPLPDQADQVRFAVAFAIRGFKVSAKYKLTEEERYELGKRVAAYFQLCGWSVWYERKAMHTAGRVPPNASGR